MSENASNHDKGSRDETKQERKRVRDITIRGKRLMDLIIYFLIGLAAICGGFLSFFSYLGYWQNKESWAIWSLYGVIFFTLTAGFVTWQKRIWDAQDAEVRATEQAKREAEKSKTDNRGWIVFDQIVVENLEVGRRYTIHAVFGYSGNTPATIVKTRISVTYGNKRLSYAGPLKPEDINESTVEPPPNPLPVMPVYNGHKFTIPVFAGPFTKELQRDLINQTAFWHVIGSVEYESGGALRYTTFCAIYEPEMGGRFGVCGGSMT